ncbi:glycosyltransferase family 4 protein [Candidatus Roizmanbacteria bacterium]|nr:glycosyltransferase family 4 protein [Candidatus Roizmanbacteria bacterium]
MQKVFVYDPTLKDERSAVRGIGRYLQILRENFADEFEFVSDLGSVKTDPYNIFINPFFNFLQKPLTLKRIARKQIAVIHDLIPLKYPSHFPFGIKGSIYILLNKLTLKNYDLIITDSEASKKDVIGILEINEEKIKVIYPCLPKSFTNLKLKIQNSELNSKLSIINSKFCIYVGDATWNKNLVNLARAIKIADVTCIFVGAIFKSPEIRANQDSPLQNINHPWMVEFQQFLIETKDDKRFIFTGFVPDTELFKLYEQASVNLLLSKAEGFGFSYLEAANFSCPSLLSDIPVLKEISNNQALFANPNNPQDIANKINETYFDKILRNKIGASAKKRSDFFSREKFRKEFLKLI